MIDLLFKQKVHEKATEIVLAKIKRLQFNVKELHISAANETKSSAGDKYETARAMLHAELLQINNQLANAMVQKKYFSFHLP